MIDTAIAKQIGAKGFKDPLHLKWANSCTKTEDDSFKTDIYIRGMDDEKEYYMENVATTKELDLPLHSVDTNKLAEKWKYLKQLPIASMKNVKPTILIGLDNIHLTIPRQVIEGPKNGPVAARTKLGWALIGNVNPMKTRVEPEVTFFTYKQQPQDELIKESWKTEAFGVNVNSKVCSKEDSRAMSIMDATTRRIGNKFETSLLWKEEIIVLPERPSFLLESGERWNVYANCNGKNWKTEELELKKEFVNEIHHESSVPSDATRRAPNPKISKSQNENVHREMELPRKGKDISKSMDPNDPESLSPNHFLIGTSNVADFRGTFGQLGNDDLYLRGKWKITRRLADYFWRRWVREYLPTLTRKTKWHQKTRNIQVGDLVVIADGDLFRNSWPRGIVSAVHPGRDGVVRVVDVKTSFESFRRPVVKLCILDVEPAELVERTDSSFTGKSNVHE